MIVLKHAIKLRCPSCGVGNLFERWNAIADVCSHCGYELKRREGDCWFFMYMSTAFFTGLIIIAMFLVTPSNLLLGQIIVGSLGLACIVLTLPLRKSIAISIDYLLENKSGGLFYEEKRK
jgi:uncharacterized protein (DUF983 family)